MTDVRVAIVGLGRMGAGYPDAAGQPRNHLSAAARADGIRVTALIDSDPLQLRKAGGLPEAGGAKLLDSLDQLPVDAVDVLVDATGNGDRSPVIRQAVACGVDVVILEKPVAASPVEAGLLHRTVQNSAVKVRVNVQRRLDPRHLAIRSELKPRPQTVLAAYGKGLQNYGSHLVDLILDWMGAVAEVRANNPWTAGPDPSIGFPQAVKNQASFAIIKPEVAELQLTECLTLNLLLQASSNRRTCGPPKNSGDGLPRNLDNKPLFNDRKFSHKVTLNFLAWLDRIRLIHKPSGPLPKLYRLNFLMST
jgi:predicted dehydrogenase